MHRTGRALRYLGLTAPPEDRRPIPVWLPTAIATSGVVGCAFSLVVGELPAAAVSATAAAAMLLLRRHTLRQRRDRYARRHIDRP
jgi:hypothetical protein